MGRGLQSPIECRFILEHEIWQDIRLELLEQIFLLSLRSCPPSWISKWLPLKTCFYELYETKRNRIHFIDSAVDSEVVEVGTLSFFNVVALEGDTNNVVMFLLLSRVE